MFHIPISHPSLTLHLTISRLSLPPDPETKIQPESSEPYLLQLQPSRPISGVASRAEIGMVELVDLMRSVAERIDGVEWGTGGF